MSVHDIIVFSTKIENPCTLTGYKHISFKDINSSKHLQKKYCKHIIFLQDFRFL